MDDAIVPDELCAHVEMGELMVGGFEFRGPVPPVQVGMCQKCLNFCLSTFDNPQPLERQTP